LNNWQTQRLPVWGRKRGGARIKLKVHQEQEFVIGGYTEPEGFRKYFGALLVGFYEGNRLKFAGRLGSGFSEKLLSSLFLRLTKFGSKSVPFITFRQLAATVGTKVSLQLK
jgi:bifunctional non-homologous end joining protein LigD